jgi:hypothetical protein
MDSNEPAGQEVPGTMRKELEFVTNAEIVPSESLPAWARNIPEICKLAEKAVAQLKQHQLTKQDPHGPTNPPPRIAGGMTMTGTSFEQIWNNVTAQTHGEAVKLSYRGDLGRWRVLVCDIYVLAAGIELRSGKSLKQPH